MGKHIKKDVASRFVGQDGEATVIKKVKSPEKEVKK